MSREQQDFLRLCDQHSTANGFSAVEIKPIDAEGHPVGYTLEFKTMENGAPRMRSIAVSSGDVAESVVTRKLAQRVVRNLDRALGYGAA